MLAEPASGIPSDAVPVFAALGDRTRLAIVARLGAQGPLTTVSLTAGTAVTRQAVTKHLQALAEAGVVSSRRSGRDRLWTLQPDRLADVSAALAAISSDWDRALLRLKALVEDQVPRPSPRRAPPL